MILHTDIFSLTYCQVLEPETQQWVVPKDNQIHCLIQQETKMIPLVLQGCNYLMKTPVSGGVSLLLFISLV